MLDKAPKILAVLSGESRGQGNEMKPPNSYPVPVFRLCFHEKTFGNYSKTPTYVKTTRLLRKPKSPTRLNTFS